MARGKRCTFYDIIVKSEKLEEKLSGIPALALGIVGSSLINIFMIGDTVRHG